MDKLRKEAAALLPKQPSDTLNNEMLREIYDGDGDCALGENLILFARESIELNAPLEREMDAEAWSRWKVRCKRVWGARCICCTCGEDFAAGYVTTGRGRGIRLVRGEDEMLYTGYADDGEPDVITFEEGETLNCPNCFTEATLTARSALRSGRTHRLLLAEVADAGDYTAVMYWMMTRTQWADGRDSTVFRPHQAVLIDREGALRRFRAVVPYGDIARTEWVPCSRMLDPMQQPYNTWANGRQIGGAVSIFGAELDGHTGEKTALDKYIGAGGAWPAAYLRLWRKHPAVENLMRQGLARAVAESIDEAIDRREYMYELHTLPVPTWANWREVKPHRMLHMSREAFRVVREANWGAEDVRVWVQWRMVLMNEDAEEYERCRTAMGAKRVGQLLEMVSAGWDNLTPVRVERYLRKQELLSEGVQLLIDYRKMLRDAALAETAETLWPRDLPAAHDRVAQTLAASRKLAWQGSFTLAAIRYEKLAWTDGELCIVIPKSEDELKAEGATLRHCVGTYGEQHVNGHPIFFVRHYRRPERSYYTLNIDMTKEAPKEIQLHGYGNERHGEHKQFKHGIPHKVREFCDRWEREVLLPWWAEQKQIEKKTGKKIGKARKMA